MYQLVPFNTIQYLMILSDNSVVRVKDVQEIFQCSEGTAKNKMRQVREGLQKPTSNNGRKGAAPITFGQVNDFFDLRSSKKK